MIRILVSYPAIAGEPFDHTYYQTEHRALIERLLGPYGLRRLELDRGLDDRGRQPNVVAAAHMLFDSLESFRAGMAAVGRALSDDLPRYTRIAPVITMSETQ